MSDDSIGVDVPDDIPSDVPSDKPIESNGEVDDWEKIRLEQPNQELPRSFFARQKLLFLSFFDGCPRLKWLFSRLQFLNIIFALAGFYLLVCFLFPVLIQLGYAGACYDEGLVYVMDYHKCFDPIELEFGYNPYIRVSKYNVLFQTISLDYGKRLDEEVKVGNSLRDVERARIEDECDLGVSSWLKPFLNMSDLVVKVEDNVSGPIVNMSDGVEVA